MLLWLATAAMAGNVYINGVDVTGSLTDTTLTDVTVTFDAQGNVHISAPTYEILVDPGDAAPKPGPMPRPTATTGGPKPAPQPTTPASQGVAEGSWWFITEDNASTGHSVRVIVNGKLAKTVHSGDEQRIEDIGPWLQPGTNQIRIESESVNAGGGAMYVYIGTGSNDEGTLNMDTPQVQFGLGASRQGPYSRDYTLEVR